MPKVGSSKSEADFQAEFDAQTLADAEAINSDGKRKKRASKAAGKMLKEQEAKARGLRKVAKKPAATKKRATKKTPKRRR